MEEEKKTQMQQESRKRVIIYLLTFILSAAYIFIGHQVAIKGSAFNSGEGTASQEYVKAKVVEIKEREATPLEWSEDGSQKDVEISATARILKGNQKGQIVEIVQTITPLIPIEIKEIEQGDKILLTKTQGEGTDLVWSFVEYIRIDTMIVFGVLFILFLVLFGRKKGVNTVISMVYTCLSIFFVLVPAILAGKNIYLWASITCIYIIAMTMLFINGGNRKSFAAGLGCTGGVFVAGLLTLLFNYITQLTGFTSENAIYIVGMNPDNPLDLKGLVFGAIVIGSLGAIMDVAMDIASALNELSENVEKISFSTLVKSGHNIGRDIMGTMANTLVLAYIGCSLSTVLLLVAYNTSYLNLFNSEMIIVEILQALVGSFGILLTIPLTSIICGLLYGNLPKKLVPNHPLSLPEDEN